MLKNCILWGLAFLMTTSSLLAQDKEGSLVKWMTVKEMMTAVKEQPRPVILDFYTDWCGWCKRMMATTYADPALSAYINQNFYPVKFDAEGKDTVEFQGKTYAPTSMAPRTPHPLAVELLQGKLMYPTTLFLNAYDKAKNEFQVKMLAPGFLEKKNIEPILVFMLENVFRNSGIDPFTQAFNTAFYDTTVTARIAKTPWKQPAAWFDGNEHEKKKTLVFLGTDWCNSCRVMERAVFTDSLMQSPLEKFALVKLNPEEQAPLFWNGKLYQKMPEDKFPFHPLTLDLTRGNFVLPTCAVLDESGKLLDAIPFFLNAETLAQILTFYGTDVYLKKSWAEFQQAPGDPTPAQKK